MTVFLLAKRLFSFRRECLILFIEFHYQIMNTKAPTEISLEQIELSLRTLRNSYQSLIEEFDRCSEKAKLQLSQVELLLSVSTKGKEKEPTSPPPTGTKKRVKRRERLQDLKMVKAYERLTMHEAIAQVLQRQGGAVDTDTVVYELYGKLDGEEFKVAKDRVTKSLSKGKQLGKWYRIPDRAGVYTASLEY